MLDLQLKQHFCLFMVPIVFIQISENDVVLK